MSLGMKMKVHCLVLLLAGIFIWGFDSCLHAADESIGLDGPVLLARNDAAVLSSGTQGEKSTTMRLKEIKELRDQKIITESEYKKKKKALEARLRDELAAKKKAEKRKAETSEKKKTAKPRATAAAPSESKADKLGKLKDLRDQELITEDEYQRKRQVLIEQLNAEIREKVGPQKDEPPALPEKKKEEDTALIADVDTNIPCTGMSNPDGVAVVIGNGRYKSCDIPPVKYAHNDAEIMKRYLVSTLGYRESNIIFVKDAVKTDFERIFGIRGNHEGELSDLIKPGKSDVFVFYSGHGAPDTNTLKGYFIPSDCASSKYALNGYSLELFHENIAKLPARHVTVVLDACFSGGTNIGKPLVASSSPFGIKIESPAVAKGNTVVITSSTGDQISSWYDEKHHGLFTYFFLKTIMDHSRKDDKKVLTYRELYESLNDTAEGVPYWAKRLHDGRKQTPTMQGSDLDREFIRF